MVQKSARIEEGAPGIVPQPLADFGSGGMNAVMAAQKEFFTLCEQASRTWLDRLKLEAEMASELAAKLGGCKSPPEAAAVYRDWMGRHVKLFAEDGERLVSQSQKLANAYTQIFANGMAGAGLKMKAD